MHNPVIRMQQPATDHPASVTVHEITFTIFVTLNRGIARLIGINHLF